MRSSTTKHRDMARSILPSRARSIPARLASVRRAGRHRIAGQLAYLGRHSSDNDWEEWDEGADLRAYPDTEIRRLVYWRRSADKLNHFERWAIEVTKHLPMEDRLGHLRAVLPAGLIGDHAMSHLWRRPELNPHYRSYYWVRAARDSEARAAKTRAENERLRKIVLELLESPGGHKALNAAVKAATSEGERPRTLAGAHDWMPSWLTPSLTSTGGWSIPAGGTRSKPRRERWAPTSLPLSARHSYSTSG